MDSTVDTNSVVEEVETVEVIDETEEELEELDEDFVPEEELEEETIPEEDVIQTSTDNKTYQITLGDGTVFTDITINGSVYVSQVSLSEELYNATSIAPITVTDGETEVIYPNMTLSQIPAGHGGNEYWYIMRELEARELRLNKIESDIEYIAMMTDVEL